MKILLILSLLFVTLVLSANEEGNNYDWGEFGSSDVLISKETVSKPSKLFMSVTQRYVFKQRARAPYTITGIKVIDKKKNNGAIAELMYGGPGYKTATIKFISKPGNSIKDEVLIYGR